MRTCGHTMGVPDMSLAEAVEFFAAIGHDGIEIRCAPDGQLQPELSSETELAQVRETITAAGLEVACLTPYFGAWYSPTDRDASIEGLAAVARAAARLGCRTVRVISGRWPVEGMDFADALSAAAEGLRRAGDQAASHGVTLAVETHGGQVAFNTEATLELLDAVDHPAVGVLLDYYWLWVAGDDAPDRCVPLLASRTVHVHVKDGVREGLSHRAVPLGQGEIPWAEVLAHLLRADYRGFLSDEYEKKWRPELPDPRQAMPANLEQLRRWIDEARRMAGP
ncbi:MAG: sugar phosphate isomerase/epimerase [Armatimonadetes bacterium]|nr:sugar phosphate isomerase/epimerase [Armatimonadota bacterium]